MKLKTRLATLCTALFLLFSLAACSSKSGQNVYLKAEAQHTPARTEAPLSDFLLNAKELFGDSCVIVAKTIKLTADIELPDDAGLILREDEAYTLDLNGRKLSACVTRDGGALISCTEGVLNVIDSKGEGMISLTATADAAALLCKGSGEIVVNGIKIDVQAPDGDDATAMAVKADGKMTVKDGTFTGATSITVDNDQVDLMIEGGSFSGFENLGGDAGIEAFLGELKKAAANKNGLFSIT